jgi:competence protein ComEA
MRSEPPAELLHRRLTAEPGADADADDDADPPDTALSRWLPEDTADKGGGWLAAVRADPGRAGVIALGGVGIIAVLVTVFTLIGNETPPVSSAKLPPVQPISSTAPPQADQPVIVSVVGLVHKPGLVTLGAGARIADALDAAGGPLDGADLLGLNMARKITDGEQIIVGIAAAPGQPVVMGSAVSASAPSAQAPPGPPKDPGRPTPTGGSVDLNTASLEDLDALPGVGPVTAAAIVGWRDAHGRFDSVDQLGDVDGIGPARLEKLRELVHV